MAIAYKMMIWIWTWTGTTSGDEQMMLLISALDPLSLTLCSLVTLQVGCLRQSIVPLLLRSGGATGAARQEMSCSLPASDSLLPTVPSLERWIRQP